MDVLRLLCWCQNVRPDDLSSISTETERENLITLGLIKRHQRSDTLLLTNGGRAFLQAALEGDVQNLTLSYHDAAIERRVRLSSLMMTAYHAGINVLTITANSLAEPSTLFITAITRSRGHNPWGSARVGAIAHLGKLPLFLPDLPAALQLRPSPWRAASRTDKLLLGRISQHRLHGGHL